MGKFSPAGSTLWARQFGTRENDAAGGAALAQGQVVGAVPDQVNLGAADVFVRAFRSRDAQRAWTLEFGTTERDRVGWALGGSNGVYLIGDTSGAFPGETNSGSVDSYLARIDVH